MSEGEDDIREALRILFSTCAGERLMRADFGGGLEPHVFARRDATAVNLLKGAIRNAILRFEPRVVVEEVNAETDGLLDGRLLFEVKYRVTATNTRSNIVFPYYIEEGTNLRLP